MRRLFPVLLMILAILSPGTALCKPQVVTYEVIFTRGAMTLGLDDSVMSSEGQERLECSVSVNNKTGKIHVGGNAFSCKSGKIVCRTADGFAAKLSHHNNGGYEDVILVIRNDGTAYMHKLMFSPAVRDQVLLGLTASFVGFWSEK